MGFIKDIVIKSKRFSFANEGGLLAITERSWRVVTKLILGPSMVHWLAKALGDCLKEEKRVFHHRQGSRSFIVQRCSNGHGRYIAVVVVEEILF